MLARRLARTTAIASSVRFRFARIPKAQPFSSASQSLFKTATMSAQAVPNFSKALSSNDSWASQINEKNPEFFKSLSAGQHAKILWLGCSDSRCPETTILGLKPGDVFVHRNIANIISPTDINSAAVIEFAVAHLKVQHVVLVGHTGCGGAMATLGDNKVGGVLDTWLSPLKEIRLKNEQELSKIEDINARAIRLAELNVERGVQILLANTVIMDAMKERGVTVHGCIFELANGKLRDLGFGSK